MTPRVHNVVSCPSSEKDTTAILWKGIENGRKREREKGGANFNSTHTYSGMSADGVRLHGEHKLPGSGGSHDSLSRVPKKQRTDEGATTRFSWPFFSPGKPVYSFFLERGWVKGRRGIFFIRKAIPEVDGFPIPSESVRMCFEQDGGDAVAPTTGCLGSTALCEWGFCKPLPDRGYPREPGGGGPVAIDTEISYLSRTRQKSGCFVANRSRMTRRYEERGLSCAVLAVDRHVEVLRNVAMTVVVVVVVAHSVVGRALARRCCCYLRSSMS